MRDVRTFNAIVQIFINAQRDHSALTKLLPQGGGRIPEDQKPDQKVEMVKDDERRRG